MTQQTLQQAYAYVLTIIGNVEDAKDVLQDALEKYETHIRDGRYQDVGKGDRWLMSIVRSTAIDFLRRKNIESRLFSNADILPELPEKEGAATEREATLYRIEQLIRRLSPKEQEVIELHYFLGMGFKEIAIQTGTSINTLLSISRRAINRLRKITQKEQLL